MGCQLAENVRLFYASCRRSKENWMRALREPVKREFRWQEELKQYGVDRQPSLATMLAPAMCEHFVPEPPTAEDTMVWLAETLTAAFKFYVPDWSEFRYVIPPGFGVEPGLYESDMDTVAWQVDDRNALLAELEKFFNDYPYASIQKIWADLLPANHPIYDRIGPVVNPEQTPEIVRVRITGVSWDKDWAAEGCEKPQVRLQPAGN